jgi:hypothetical protein
VKLVRVLTETPAEASNLVALLENRGFLVQTTDKSDLFSPSVDLEIDLRVVPLGVAFQMAHGLVPETSDVFAYSELFTERTLGQEPSPAPCPVVDVPSRCTHRKVTILDTRPYRHPDVPVVEVTSPRDIAHRREKTTFFIRACLALIGVQLRTVSERSRAWLVQARRVVPRNVDTKEPT